MRIYLVFDSGDPHANMSKHVAGRDYKEQLEGFLSEDRARARCEQLNERDYPGMEENSEDAVEDQECWTWAHVDVEEDS